ncbi:MAG: serine hydrolase [Betaproteobacteria bacterium]|jgi:CubicO group peptidase (beta-lactamase class C family)|nr:MAG: serine hydrolase [Betaproteobacteria bacterium]
MSVKTAHLIDVSRVPAKDSSGAGAVSTAGDYLRFCQMLINGGELESKRVMSHNTIALMTSEHLGSRIKTTLTGRIVAGHPGVHFRLWLRPTASTGHGRRGGLGR